MAHPWSGLRFGVCEDDPDIRRLIRDALESEGAEVLQAHNGAEAMRLFERGAGLSAIVMDIGLPDSDGRDVLAALRAAAQEAPVLLLSARSQLHDRISGFAVGADDYLPKPFAVVELIARLHALVRRAVTAGDGLPELLLDPARMTLRFGDTVEPLTPTEYRLLALLLGRRGQIVRRPELRAAGWPLGAHVEENTLDSYLRRIRRHVDSLASDTRIRTVRGVGYVLE